MDRAAHWDDIYRSKAPQERSWHQEDPGGPIAAILATGVPPERPLIDIGGSSGLLVERLLQRGWEDLTVLDISAEAIAQGKSRLGAAASRIHWICADVTTWRPQRRYALWHDRAALHFLTQASDRRAYVGTLRAALQVGGFALISGFGPQGPLQCSRLPVTRTDAQGLQELLGADFVLVGSAEVTHTTPWGTTQQFVGATFRRERAGASP